ncbi:MAG: ATPase [Thermus sp.]|uniref:ATPase n=1 Tax=Thermus sp. TaxID=275 RepID=UPI003919BE8B
MKRKRLAELVREEVEVLGAPQAEAASPDTPTQEAPETPPPHTPKYLTYVRKECRLRPDQLDALTALARKLNRERKGKGERITENTLIRWAVDFYLKNISESGYLAGRNNDDFEG